MNYTNVNIKSGDKSFKYIVEYLEEDIKISSDVKTKYFYNDTSLFFYNELESNVLSNKNTWKDIKEKDTKTYNDTAILPNITNLSTFNLYFPRYSVDTYVKNVHYVLTINTWVNGVCIYLGSYLINRRNAIAPSTGVKKFLNDEYYEYVSVNTLNPLHLNYSDEWSQFRQVFCGEKIEDGLQKNNSASNINITITPVKLIDGVWIKLDEYDSSQSVIPISNEKNYLTANLKFNNVGGKPEFNCGITFNPVYNGDFELYLNETYQIFGNVDLKYCFVIGDKENPYKYKEITKNNFETSAIFELNDFVFDSWSDFIEGMYAQVYFIVQKNDNDIIVISSNKVFITQEEFKYFMNEKIRTVNLNDLDMELKSFDVVNVIENKVVSVERPNDYKSNIVKPIFVKVQDAGVIRLHRSVTENISINLDAYKNKVNAFVLKIGDMNFYEIGRINSGIIFKVIGTNLPDVDGFYYILNENGELVTTGKYSIV
jgi:hypothetical protein